jgi:hypothetical protein
LATDPDPEIVVQLLNFATYGEMTTVHVGSKTWIFLNSHRVVSEIIAKRGSVTNTRSPMPISSGIVSHDGRSLILPQEAWAERRRVMHSLLSGSALKQYGEWQDTCSSRIFGISTIIDTQIRSSITLLSANASVNQHRN